MTSVSSLVCALQTLPSWNLASLGWLLLLLEPGKLPVSCCGSCPLERGPWSTGNPAVWEDLPAFFIVEQMLQQQEMLVDLDDRNRSQGGLLAREDERECHCLSA